MSDTDAANEETPEGTKKPDLPSGTKKPDGPPGTKKPEGPGTKKPAGPPSADASDEPAGTKKPEGPPGAKKPDGPDTKKPDGPPGTKSPEIPLQTGGTTSSGSSSGTTKPAGPPGAGDADGATQPAMPPGFSGDGGGDGLSRKDFQSDQDVRWCPGCGDYAILSTVQRVLPDLGVKKENQVFISGIGCSGRFPYYMDTYGMHSIHGRAPAFATGLKTSRPELDVWIVTGDGDALSIGGNHLIHVLRRNVDMQMLLFNNQIYGLTKGQYSPTSELGQVTKSSPYGTIDKPFNPVALAIGADASFVGRTMDRDPQHMKAMMKAAYRHRGSAFLEIYQNCNIFNDGAFFEFTEKETQPERALFLEDGEPLTYADGDKGLRLDGLQIEPVDLTSGRWSVDDCLVHDETNHELAHLLGRLFWQDNMPRPFGVIYRAERPTYEEQMHTQIDGITEKEGAGDLDALLHAGDTWTVE
jgi:2-oxoglutarate ferredoxin oxidoreductase subunit beta